MNGLSNKDRRLRVTTWNFSGLCSEHKQKEVSEVLSRPDVIAGQESLEREEKTVAVEGCKMFWKASFSFRGEGGVGFLVRGCLVDEVEFVSNVRYEESVWMKVRGGRGREALYICCIYMPTDSTAASVVVVR